MEILRILYAGDIMKRAYMIRIFIAIIILGVSLLAYNAAYYLTIQYYKDDEPYWEHDEFDFMKEPSKTDDDIIETTTTPLFLLTEKEGYIIVEYFQGGKIYDETDIKVRDLPDDLQREIIHGIPIKNFDELYDFLENYSS